jgi:RsiW-degrading membrane proteinase PrsW (M82 family)
MIYVIPLVSVLIYGTILFWAIGRKSQESPKQLLWCVAMGGAAAMISLSIEYGWLLLTWSFAESHHAFVFLESFIGVALVEESAKWIWLWLVIRRWQAFNQYVDGVLYVCGIAAGFNLVEGYLYILTAHDMANMLIRSFTAVPAHFLFAVVMGFLFSRFQFESGRFLWFSLLIPFLIHGLYDFFILQQYTEVLMGGALLVLIGCLVLSIWLCRIAMRVDQKRELSNQL